MKQGHRKQPMKDITAILDNIHAKPPQVVGQSATKYIRIEIRCGILKEKPPLIS